MKTSIKKTICPEDSKVKSQLKKIDYEDAFSFTTSGSNENIEDIYLKIFNTAPKWVEYALKFRNLLVSPFGLKTEMKKMKIQTLKEGEKIGIFKIYKIYDDEVIAGEDDKHLDFRVSVHQNSESTITVCTIVHYNNSFGKLYMTLIRPFHKIVVKSMLKSALKRW